MFSVFGSIYLCDLVNRSYTKLGFIIMEQAK